MCFWLCISSGIHTGTTERIAMSDETKRNTIAPIRAFFGDVTTKELRELTKEDREELADMIEALPLNFHSSASE